MRYEVEVDVAASGQQVWDVLHDVVRWSEWTPTIEEVRRLDDGDFGVGSKSRVKQPKMSAMIWEVTEDEPGKSFTWVSKRPGLQMVAGHHITATGDTSHVKLDFALSGPLAPVVSPLAGGRIRRYVDLEAQSLKARCENGTA